MIQQRFRAKTARKLARLANAPWRVAYSPRHVFGMCTIRAQGPGWDYCPLQLALVRVNQFVPTGTLDVEYAVAVPEELGISNVERAAIIEAADWADAPHRRHLEELLGLRKGA